MSQKKEKLLDQVVRIMQQRRYAPRTIQAYRYWIRCFILFHDKRHPREMGAPEIEAFLSHLVTDHNVAPATQNQALSALLLLYRQILALSLESVISPTKARKSPKQPTVLTPTEIAALLANMKGISKLVALLLYGAGLRINECVTLRVKDLDFAYRSLTVHDGKGAKDRVVPMPESLIELLRRQIESVRRIHESDLGHGFGSAPLPYALKRKMPRAPKELRWQYLFPSRTLSPDRRDGDVRRHHLSPSTVQRDVKRAAEQAGLLKRVTCHTLRHNFATHLLQNGYDIRTVQELLGHKDVKTTMIYTHVLKQGGLAVRSPLDGFP